MCVYCTLSEFMSVFCFVLFVYPPLFLSLFLFWSSLMVYVGRDGCIVREL